MPPHLQKIVDDYEKDMSDPAKTPWFLRQKAAVPVGLVVAAGFGFVIHSLDDVSSDLHRATGCLLSWLEPERARSLLLWAAMGGWLPRDYDKDDPYLVIEPQEGLRFMTPVGLAAGVDREARAPNAFLNMGFGSVEVGPVGTAAAAAAGGAVADVDEVRRQLVARQEGEVGFAAHRQVAHIGLIGATIAGDAAALPGLAQALAPHVDYLALELSALPADLLSDPEALRQVVSEVVGAALLGGQGPKVFLRVHPGAWPEAAAPAAARRRRAAVLSVAALTGGASGLVLCVGGGTRAPPATDIIGEVYRQSRGRLVLIACGDMAGGGVAMDWVAAGASTVQFSSALMTEGLQACRRIKNEMSQVLMHEGYVNLHDAVGASHRKKKGRRKNLWRPKGADSSE